MTSVTFPFKVGVPQPGEKTIPLLDVEFRYTTKTARQLERACNGNMERVLSLGKSVEASVLLVCYGQRWNQPTLTEDHAADQLDEFIAAGGDIVDLTVALYKALNESGVYGKPKEPTRPTEGGTTTAPAAA